MSIMSFFFGKPEAAPVVVTPVETKPVEEPVVVTPPKPRKSEAQTILEHERSKVNKAYAAIEDAQEELYEKRAQLNVKHKILTNLFNEIEGHRSHIDDLTTRAKVASEVDRRDLINEGQKSLTILMRKEQEHASQKESILMFEQAIDMLESTVSQNVIATNRKQSDLTTAETVISIQAVSSTVGNHLSLSSFKDDDNQLAVLVEKTKLKMEDTNAEMSAITNSDTTLALTFRKQVETIEDAEITNA